ncbi:MAG TPA: hypothetical protein PLS49_04675 [Candidatus Woesebacteria bacterium]|nr:hypothetical protein [Candidatus Woesebacteria bacterium]
MLNIQKPYSDVAHSFLIRPNIQFESQHEGEEVILVIRKHLFTQLNWIINSVLLIVVGSILSFIVFPQFLAPNLIGAFYIFLLIFTFSYFWLNFLFWYFTVGIVTNERILDLDFLSILYKEFTATTINQVSDITTKIGGFAGSLFNYGDVEVKTEGFAQNIEFHDVSMPTEIVEIINNLMRNYQPPS